MYLYPAHKCRSTRHGHLYHQKERYFVQQHTRCARTGKSEVFLLFQVFATPWPLHGCHSKKNKMPHTCIKNMYIIKSLFSTTATTNDENFAAHHTSRMAVARWRSLSSNIWLFPCHRLYNIRCSDIFGMPSSNKITSFNGAPLLKPPKTNVEFPIDVAEWLYRGAGCFPSKFGPNHLIGNDEITKRQLSAQRCNAVSAAVPVWQTNDF